MVNLQMVGVMVTLAFAGFLQGLTGFGFGLSAMALLPLVISLTEAQAVITVVNIPACAVNSTALRKHIPWRDCVGLMLGSLVGVPLGFWYLTSLPQDMVERSLGAALCGMVALDLILSRGQGIPIPRWFGPIVGLIGGSLGGAFNIGGPPIVAYLYSRPWTQQQVVAGLSVIFLANSLMRISLLLIGEFLTPQVWMLSLWSVLPMLIATIGGHRLMHHVPRQRLKIAVYLVLLVIGVKYLCGGAIS